MLLSACIYILNTSTNNVPRKQKSDIYKTLTLACRADIYTLFIFFLYIFRLETLQKTYKYTNPTGPTTQETAYRCKALCTDSPLVLGCMLAIGYSVLNHIIHSSVINLCCYWCTWMKKDQVVLQYNCFYVYLKLFLCVSDFWFF